VDVSRADEFVARHGLPAPTVLEIDVEGAEHALLEELGPLQIDQQPVEPLVYPPIVVPSRAHGGHGSIL
jgi:hypothetical protein